ncbi:hypothetical protein BDE02_06G209900 [Populus trichocarpa]|nr:hypothetical protein BDE02_06G209900 [Populus trichocarpa]
MSRTSNCRTDYVKTVKIARWEYRTRPIYGWGSIGSKQNSTTGWLAAFPVFEPHWQICTASGFSTGWIEWEGERFEFKDDPSCSEKNWGGAFSRKLFWLQCNVFEGTKGEVTLTAVGGVRQLPGPAGSEIHENAALVILKVTSDMAAVEVGGGPWFTNWKGKTSAPELLRRALRVPIDLDAVYNSVPFFKPPGL